MALVIVLASHGNSALGGTDNWISSSAAGVWFTAGTGRWASLRRAMTLLLPHQRPSSKGRRPATANSLTIQAEMSRLAVISVARSLWVVKSPWALWVLRQPYVQPWHHFRQHLQHRANGTYSDTSSGNIILSGSSRPSCGWRCHAVVNSQITGHQWIYQR